MERNLEIIKKTKRCAKIMSEIGLGEIACFLPYLNTVNPMLYILSVNTASLGDKLRGPQRPKVNCMDWNILSDPQMLA